MDCLRCHGEMEHLGQESLQLGQYGLLTGHLSNLFPVRWRSISMPAGAAASWSFTARTRPAFPSGCKKSEAREFDLEDR